MRTEFEIDDSNRRLQQLSDDYCAGRVTTETYRRERASLIDGISGEGGRFDSLRRRVRELVATGQLRTRIERLMSASGHDRSVLLLLLLVAFASLGILVIGVVVLVG